MLTVGDALYKTLAKSQKVTFGSKNIGLCTGPKPDRTGPGPVWTGTGIMFFGGPETGPVLFRSRLVRTCLFRSGPVLDLFGPVWINSIFFFFFFFFWKTKHCF